MSSTTSYRMSVGIGETITGILNRAENGTPLPKMMERILQEAVAQVDAEATPQTLPIVRILRSQINAQMNAQMNAQDAQDALPHLRVLPSQRVAETPAEPTKHGKDREK